MANKENYQVAIDILRCHLGMTLDEAHKELGLDQAGTTQLNAEQQELLLALNSENS